jgi:hypothetical protein
MANRFFRKPFKPFNILKEDKENINDFINSELNLIKIILVITHPKTVKARAYLIIIIEGRIKKLKEDPKKDKEKKNLKKRSKKRKKKEDKT